MLLILLGTATRLARFGLGLDKSYELCCELGVSTDTYDAAGVVLERRPWQHISRDDVDRQLAPLLGANLQTPPAYSALKVQGKRAYQLARAGVQPELEPRAVKLYAARVLSFTPPLLYMQITCSSGYYVRSLVHELGASLGCGGHLRSLRRTAIGAFGPEQMHSLEQLQALTADGSKGDWRQLLLPVQALLPQPVLELDAQQSARFRQGAQLSALHQLDPAEPERLYQVYLGEQLLGLGRAQGGRLRPTIVLGKL